MNTVRFGLESTFHTREWQRHCLSGQSGICHLGSLQLFSLRRAPYNRGKHDDGFHDPFEMTGKKDVGSASRSFPLTQPPNHLRRVPLMSSTEKRGPYALIPLLAVCGINAFSAIVIGVLYGLLIAHSPHVIVNLVLVACVGLVVGWIYAKTAVAWILPSRSFLVIASLAAAVVRAVPYLEEHRARCDPLRRPRRPSELY